MVPVHTRSATGSFLFYFQVGGFDESLIIFVDLLSTRAHVSLILHHHPLTRITVHRRLVDDCAHRFMADSALSITVNELQNYRASQYVSSKFKPVHPRSR